MQQWHSYHHTQIQWWGLFVKVSVHKSNSIATQGQHSTTLCMYINMYEMCWNIMLGTHPVSHTGGLGPFHDCTSHRQHCHSERSQLCQKELLDCHASETSLEIDWNSNIIVLWLALRKEYSSSISKHWNRGRYNVSLPQSQLQLSHHPTLF